jgi:hypothetical protein
MYVELIEPAGPARTHGIVYTFPVRLSCTVNVSVDEEPALSEVVGRPIASGQEQVVLILAGLGEVRSKRALQMPLIALGWASSVLILTANDWGRAGLISHASALSQ